MKKNKETILVIGFCVVVIAILMIAVSFVINRDDFNDDKQSETESVIETDESTFTFVEESKESEQSEEAEKEETSNEQESVETETENALETETESEYCLIIIGDSRACSLSNSVNSFGEWTLLADNRVAPDQGWILYESSEMKLAICEYGGGSLTNGAYEKGLDWAKEVMSAEWVTANTKSCIFNIFGLGDVNTGFFPDSNGYYNEKGEAFAKENQEKCVYYQCTVGPIDEKGTIGQAGVWTNHMIQEFNQKFEETDFVKIYDLNDFLQKEGYECVISDSDPTGVHYQIETDRKMLEEFVQITLMQLSKE